MYFQGTPKKTGHRQCTGRDEIKLLQLACDGHDLTNLMMMNENASCMAFPNSVINVVSVST